MNNDMRKQRRKVAWRCFEAYLTEEQLIQAVRILEHGYQMDSVSNLIAYITRICADFGIEANTRKSLYSQFHQMMSEDTASLPDPLSVIQQTESYKTPKVAPEPPPAAPPIIAAAPELPPVSVEAVLPASLTTVAEPEPAVELPLSVRVFSYFMQQLLFYVQQPDEFFTALTELANQKKHGSKIIQSHVDSWSSNVSDFFWAVDLSEQQLAAIVHLVYTALCEALGPIVADDVFHKALTKSEQQPEARQFSPSRFL